MEPSVPVGGSIKLLDLEACPGARFPRLRVVNGAPGMISASLPYFSARLPWRRGDASVRLA